MVHCILYGVLAKDGRDGVSGRKSACDDRGGLSYCSKVRFVERGARGIARGREKGRRHWRVRVFSDICRYLAPDRHQALGYARLYVDYVQEQEQEQEPGRLCFFCYFERVEGTGFVRLELRTWADLALADVESCRSVSQSVSRSVPCQSR
jgi:hypothetical protein